MSYPLFTGEQPSARRSPSMVSITRPLLLLPLVLLALTGPVDARTISPLPPALTRRAGSAVPATLRCIDQRSLCASSRVSDTRKAITALSRRINEPVKSAIDDPLVLLRSSTVQAKSTSTSSSSSAKDEDGEGTLRVMHCEWLSCASVRLTRALPGQSGGADERAVVAEATARLSVMDTYLGHSGMTAAESCDTRDRPPPQAGTSQAIVAESYGIVVRYWQQSSIDKC